VEIEVVRQNIEIRESGNLDGVRRPGGLDRLQREPGHVRFVQERWLAEVGDFLEIDFEARSQPVGYAA
jgi:hypothetical protein